MLLFVCLFLFFMFLFLFLRGDQEFKEPEVWATKFVPPKCWDHRNGSPYLAEARSGVVVESLVL